MDRTNDRTDEGRSNQSFISEMPFEEETKDPTTSTPIRFFSTETDDGDVVAMEISPKGDVPTIASMLANALDALERFVDKTPAPAIVTITNADEYREAFDQFKKDKIEERKVEETLKPFSDIAYRVHRTITGKTNQYKAYSGARLKVYDEAIVRYDREQEEQRLADAKRIRDAALKEDEDRRQQEAKTLEKRGDVEGAKQVLAEKPREIHVAIPSRTPKIDGGSIRKRYVAHSEDEERFVRAIGRPDIYREVAAFLRGSEVALRALGWAPKLKKADAKKIQAMANALADELTRRADGFPVIPFNMVEVSETQITKVANAVNGKLDWPGISVEEDRKTSARTR
jgi:hypothetical protein